MGPLKKLSFNCFTRCYFSRIGIYKCLNFPNTECVCSTKVGAAQNRLLPKLPTWALGNTMVLSFKIALLDHLDSLGIWDMDMSSSMMNSLSSLNAASSHLSRHCTSAKGLVWASRFETATHTIVQCPPFFDGDIGLAHATNLLLGFLWQIGYLSQSSSGSSQRRYSLQQRRH